MAGSHLKDHTEAVLIEYNPDMISYEKILKLASP
jgi:peptide methionine sulfoxide reductase MsrA